MSKASMSSLVRMYCSCQASLKPCMIALFYSTELFFTFYFPVDVYTVDRKASMKRTSLRTSCQHLTCHIQRISPAEKFPQLLQSIMLCPSVWEICNTPLWWLPTWGTWENCHEMPFKVNARDFWFFCNTVHRGQKKKKKSLGTCPTLQSNLFFAAFKKFCRQIWFIF